MEVKLIDCDVEKLLKNKVLGGVTKKSAIEAINHLKSQATETIGKLQQELETLKGKSAQEIAELTTKKDRLELQVNNIKMSRVSEKTLANGDKKIRKVNSNGAVMEKYVNADGRLVQVEVTLLDGTKRRTTYNPATVKPLKTYTDTAGEEVLFKYNDEGNAISLQKVNAKKKSSTPVKLIDTQVDEKGTIKKIYSDGSEKLISTKRGLTNSITTIVLKKNGNIIQEQVESHNGVFKMKMGKNTYQAKVKFNANTLYKEATVRYKKVCNNQHITSAEVKTPKGEIYKLERLTNRFG